MPDTGLFYVLNIDRCAISREHPSVIAISVRCNSCQHVTHSTGPDLQSIPGGTLLACAQCGGRQAVSNARLVECDHTLAARADSSVSPMPG
ncbi:hypothetical protein B0X78_05790 [bacterium AM6]|nr:hypothetical protein B0X78_05790 [bacterium AM6]